MNRKHVLILVLSAAVLSGCATGVQVTHSPLVATNVEQITFTAKSFETSPPADSRMVQIWVNGILVKGCDYSPCTFTGGPYTDGYVHYAAIVRTQGSFLGLPVNVAQVDGYYHTEIAGAGYASSNPYIRGRVRSTPTSTVDNADMVFHMADDYTDAGENMSDFISDATDKVQDILGSKEILEEELNHLNFWVYKREASASGCGTVNALAPIEVTFSDVDAVLHTDNFIDCTWATHFSAEGHNTKAFLHETAHALIGLGDEYDGPTYYAGVNSPEPNIFPSETDCQDEQALKGRDPTECYEFTARDGGWWGIHPQTTSTVMSFGTVGNPWGIEAEERVNWFFDGF